MPQLLKKKAINNYVNQEFVRNMESVILSSPIKSEVKADLNIQLGHSSMLEISKLFGLKPLKYPLQAQIFEFEFKKRFDEYLYESSVLLTLGHFYTLDMTKVSRWLDLPNVFFSYRYVFSSIVYIYTLKFILIF